jgi:hypothetical protein
MPRYDTDDDLPLVPCPYCRAEIVEDAERCPHCGNYISAEDAPPGERKSAVWIVLMVLALLAAVSWVFAG